VFGLSTFHCHINQDLASSCAKPTIHVNADPFLETVPPICLPPSQSDVAGEDLSENSIHDEVLDPLSMDIRCSTESVESAESGM